MEEQLITFETAKLAKEKGYIDMSYPVYSYDGFKILSYTNSMNIYPCSTQSLLQKWLRDKHKIHIEIKSYTASYMTFNIYLLNNIVHIKYLTGRNIGNSESKSKRFPSYEEALEQGLQEALKLI